MSISDSHTLQSRALTLLNRCKKAIRLYSRGSKTFRTDKDRLSEAQLSRWREVNEQLFAELYGLLSEPDKRDQSLRREIETMEARYAVVLRGIESELDRRKGELQRAVDREEYIATVEISTTLVEAKATFQATKAALAEIRSVLQNQGPEVSQDELRAYSASIKNNIYSDGLFEEHSLLVEESFSNTQTSARDKSSIFSRRTNQENTLNNEQSNHATADKAELIGGGKVIPLRR